MSRRCIDGRACRALALACAMSWALPGCNVPAAALESASGSGSESAAEIDRQILAALKDRRYADAITATRRADASPAEKDFAAGMLALEGLSDPQAVQRPRESAGEALSLIEASALAGHAQAVSTLASTFSRGLAGGADNAVLIPADAQLAACWNEAKARPTQAAACAAMRSGGRPSRS